MIRKDNVVALCRLQNLMALLCRMTLALLKIEEKLHKKELSVKRIRRGKGDLCWMSSLIQRVTSQTSVTDEVIPFGLILTNSLVKKEHFRYLIFLT